MKGPLSDHEGGMRLDYGSISDDVKRFSRS